MPAVRVDDGGAVLLSPPAVRLLVAVLCDVVRRAAGHGESLPAELLDVLVVLGPVAAGAAAGSAAAGSTAMDCGAESVFLSAVGAARRAGVRESAVRRAAGRGTLRGSKVDGCWRFTVEAVDEWTERYRVGRRANVLDRQADDEVQLRELVAAVETELSDIDAEMVEEERGRDADLALAAAGDAAGTPLECWAARERADGRARRIADLSTRRRPLIERRTTALGILGPLDALRARAVQLRQEFAIRTRLAEWQPGPAAVGPLAVLREWADVVELAQRDLNAIGAESLPMKMRNIAKIVRTFGEPSHPYSEAARIDPENVRSQLDHLRQEAA